MTTNTASPRSLVENYLRDYFLSRFTMYQTRSLNKHNKLVPTGSLPASTFALLANEFQRYVQALILENTLTARKANYYYYKFLNDPTIYKITAEQDPTKTFPFFVATDYTPVPPDTETTTNNPNLYVLEIDPTLFFNEESISQWTNQNMPLNILSILQLMLHSYLAIVFSPPH